MSWTEGALIATFLVLATDALGASPMWSAIRYTSQEKRRKDDEESFAPQSPVRACKHVLFFNRSGAGSGKHKCRSPHSRSGKCSGDESCWERSSETGCGGASDIFVRNPGGSRFSTSGYTSSTSRSASSRSASHTFDNWSVGGAPPVYFRGRACRQDFRQWHSRRSGNVDGKLRSRGSQHTSRFEQRPGVYSKSRRPVSVLSAGRRIQHCSFGDSLP